jgi:hypothetical protein
MKVCCAWRTDMLTVILKDNTPVAESDEQKSGVILGYVELGNLISLEILDASKRVTETRKMEFLLAEYPMGPWYKVATPRPEVREGRSFHPDEFAVAL